MSGIFSGKKFSVTKVRRIVLLVTAFVIGVSLLSPLIQNTASADSDYDAMSLDDLGKSASYYVTLETCVSNNSNGPTISAPSANYGPTQIDWFNDNSAYGYIYPDGKTDCREIMGNALTLWNVSASDMLTAIGYKQTDKTSYDWSTTTTTAQRKANFISYVKQITGSSDPSKIPNAAEYARDSYWWNNNCVVKALGKTSSITDSVIKARLASGATDSGDTSKGQATTTKYVTITQTNKTQYSYIYNYSNSTTVSGKGGSITTTSPFTFPSYGYHDTSTVNARCDTLAKALGSLAPDYTAYLNAKAVTTLCQNAGYSDTAASSSNPTHDSLLLSACESGYSHQKDPTFCATEYNSKDTPLSLAACKTGAAFTATQIANAVAQDVSDLIDNKGNGGGETATSCGVEGIGWIVCPAINFMGSLLAGVFSAIADNFLNVNLSLFETGSGTYIGWGVFRNIANVAFVIILLIIIFSQLSGVGVTNYGVKKMLPRLVVAAILVNISYFVCQLAVDLSNVLGYSLKAVFDNIATLAHVPVSTDPDASGNGFGIVAIIGLVLGTATVSYFALGTLIPVLLAAIVAVLMIILILILRKALIVLLIVVSPLAFVAYLLPNTESLFTKWRKAFTTLLLLFPIIAVVFGAASLASQILIGADKGDIGTQIAAVGTAALPFFVVPALLKGALDGIGNIGGKLNGFAGKAGGGLGRAGSKAFDNTALARGRALRKQSRSNYRDEKFAGAVGKGGARAFFARGANFTKGQKYANAALERSTRSASFAAANKEVDAAKDVIINANMTGDQRKELALKGTVTVNGKVISGGETMQKAAIQEVMRTGSYGDQSALIEASSTAAFANLRQTVASSVAANGLGSKDPALAGKRIDDISQGNFNYKTAIEEAVGEGKYTADSLATMNDDARRQVIEVASNAAAGGDASLLNSLRAAATAMQASPEVYAKLSTSQKATDQIAYLATGKRGPTL